MIDVKNKIKVKEDSELESLIQDTLTWIEKMLDSEVAGLEEIEPIINLADFYDITFNDNKRKDICEEGISMDVLHKNTSCKENNFFVVPEVVKKS